MKCPKCGFVSYPGIPQCKKCGYSFAPGKPAGAPPQILGLSAASAPAPAATYRETQTVEPHPSLHLPEAAPSGPEPPREAPGVVSTAPTIPAAPPPPVVAASPLQEELSQRVEDFRRRRARLKGRGDTDDNLEFDFHSEREAEAETAPDSRLAEFPQPGGAFDAILEKPEVPPTADTPMDSMSLHHPAAVGALDDAPFDSGEYELEADPTPARPVEIVLDSQPVAEETEESARVSRLPLAPLGRRFLGGLVDGLVLVVAAALFALIFWRAGGHLSPHPLNFVVFGFIAVAFIMGYFGAFTALTSTTPGLLWMGIEARSQTGGLPTPQQAFWRAFGYLVSISALMLGFIWALVDSDGLTWHDRMSDTFLTDAEDAEESRKLRVKS